MLRAAVLQIFTKMRSAPHLQSAHLNTLVQNIKTYYQIPIMKRSITTITNLSTISRTLVKCGPIVPSHGLALQPVRCSILQNRTLTKFSLKKGKRKTVKAVIKRFKRLHWGAWIRTRAGRHKKMFKKSPALKRRLRQHVFVNAKQSGLLDIMVTKFWRRPKYYVDDPYEPYHKREEYFAFRSKPVNSREL